MRILFVFDSLETKFYIESQMLRNGISDFHSILNIKYFLEWSELYDPTHVFFVMDNITIQRISKLIAKTGGVSKYYLVSENLLKGNSNDIEIVSKVDLIRLSEEKFNTIPTLKEIDKDDFLIKINQKYKRIRIDEIVYLEAEGNYVNMVLLDRSYNIRTNLKSILEILPDYFMRSHVSYIVNTKKIDAIQINEQIIEAFEFKIPFSRRYKKELLGNFHLG